jgi:hypothetical protein
LGEACNHATVLSDNNAHRMLGNWCSLLRRIRKSLARILIILHSMRMHIHARTVVGSKESLWPPSNQHIAPADPPTITAPRSLASRSIVSTPNLFHRLTPNRVLPPDTAMMSAAENRSLITPTAHTEHLQ